MSFSLLFNNSTFTQKLLKLFFIIDYDEIIYFFYFITVINITFIPL